MRNYLLTLLIPIFSFSIHAQGRAGFEVISVDNAPALTQIMSWSAAGWTFTPAAFSPDGSELAIALPVGQIMFLSTETLETIRTIEVKTEGEWLDYSADGSELLLAERNGAYTLWNVNTGEVITSSTGSISAFWFTPSSDVRKYLLYNFGESYVTVHDTITGNELLRVDEVDIYALSYDGTLLLTKNFDHMVRLWDVETGEARFEIQPPTNLTHDSGTLYGAGFTPDGQVWVNWPQYSVMNDEVIWFSPLQFWDIQSATMVSQLSGEDYYRSLIFDPTETHIVATGLDIQHLSEGCWMWNIASNEQVGCYALGTANLTFSPDGNMIAYNHGTMPNTYIREVGVRSLPIAVLKSPSSWFIEFSPDGRFLVTIDQEIRLWGIPGDR
jgi:WD40 repeat protein